MYRKPLPNPDLAEVLLRTNPTEYAEPPPPVSAGQAADRAARVAELALRAEQEQGLWHAGDRRHDQVDSQGNPRDLTPPAGQPNVTERVRRWIARFGDVPAGELAHLLGLKASVVRSALGRIRRGKGQKGNKDVA